jgi:hypothetical protein
MPGPATPPITYRPGRSRTPMIREPNLGIQKILHCVAVMHDVMSLLPVSLRRNISIGPLKSGGLETVDDERLRVFAVVPPGERGKPIRDWAVYPSPERLIGYVRNAPGRRGLPDKLGLNPHVYVVAYGREPRR